MKITEHYFKCLKWKDNNINGYNGVDAGELKCEEYTESRTGYNQYSSGEIQNIYKMKNSVNSGIYSVLSVFTFLIIIIFIPMILIKLNKKGWKLLKK